MSEQAMKVLILVVYRLCTMLVGLAMVSMGYRLFTKGVYEKAGEFKAAWGDRNLLLKQAAPGTFFALFGTFVIVVSLWKGVDVSSQTEAGESVRATRLSPLKDEADEIIEAMTTDAELDAARDKARTAGLIETTEDFPAGSSITVKKRYLKEISTVGDSKERREALRKFVDLLKENNIPDEGGRPLSKALRSYMKKNRNVGVGQ